MKVLVVNDNPAINTIIEEILDVDGHEIYGAVKLDDAEMMLETFHPEVIIIEETVDGEDAMKFIDKISPESKTKILMLTSGKKQRPMDKPMIVGFIHKPFKAAEILDPIRRIRDGDNYIPSAPLVGNEGKKGPKKRLFGRSEPKKEEKKEEEEDIIRYGKSYKIYENTPKSVYLVTKEFIPQAVDVFVVSFDRKKTIQTNISDDKAEVMTVSRKGGFGSEDASMLGTIMSRIMGFIDQAVRPVIVFDNFSQMIEINDINRALMLVCQIFTGTTKQFSMVLSVREEMFTDKDKALLARYLERYNFDLEKRMEDAIKEPQSTESQTDLQTEQKDDIL